MKAKVTKTKESVNPYLSPDAGTPDALRRSINFINSLPKRRPTSNPKTPFKKLYK